MSQEIHTRSRRNRQKSKKKHIGLLLVSLSILSLICLGFLAFFLLKNPPKQENVERASVSQTSTERAPSQEKIRWVKQDQPVKIPILMYHAIHVMDPAEAANANLILSPDVFESQLQALKEAGYYTLSPDEAYKILTENVLPDQQKVVWLTFDDSLRDFYTNAFPLLQKYQMKGTNNVITGFVEAGREDILTLEQIKEMKAAGMSFEGHTVNHPDLAQSSPDIQNTELANSKAYLDQALNQDTTTIAYPSGRYSDTTMTIADALGYKMGLTTNNGLASLADGLLSLNRVRIMPDTTGSSLLAEIATQE